MTLLNQPHFGEGIVIQHRLPAIGAAIIRPDGHVSVGVMSTRRAGGSQAVSVNDIWHIGSCAKAMNATLIGKLVEEGVLDWETELRTIFPVISEHFVNGLADVTIRMLLSHQSHLIWDFDYGSFSGYGAKPQRLQAVVKAGSETSMFSEKTGYSNVGFIIAGAIVEKVTGRPYEDIIREKLYEPLGMKSATFDGESTDYDRPASHNAQGQVIEFVDILNHAPAMLRPAGCTRMTLDDWVLFVREHLKGARGDSGLLQMASAFRRATEGCAVPSLDIGIQAV